MVLTLNRRPGLSLIYTILSWTLVVKMWASSYQDPHDLKLSLGVMSASKRYTNISCLVSLSISEKWYNLVFFIIGNIKLLFHHTRTNGWESVNGRGWGFPSVGHSFRHIHFTKNPLELNRENPKAKQHGRGKWKVYKQNSSSITSVEK